MDPVAFGDPFEWAVGRLRSRLAEMLRESGGEQLADSLDPAAVDTALDRLAELRAAAAAGITS
jgi:hypothetical protein